MLPLVPRAASVKARVPALLLVLAADTARAVPVPQREPRTKETTAHDRGTEGNRILPSRDVHVSGAAGQQTIHGGLERRRANAPGGDEPDEQDIPCHMRVPAASRHLFDGPELPEAVEQCTGVRYGAHHVMSPRCELLIKKARVPRDDVNPSYDAYDIQCRPLQPRHPIDNPTDFYHAQYGSNDVAMVQRHAELIRWRRVGRGRDAHQISNYYRVWKRSAYVPQQYGFEFFPAHTRRFVASRLPSRLDDLDSMEVW